MHAIQVTVQNAADHDVDAFNHVFLKAWQDLLEELRRKN